MSFGKLIAVLCAMFFCNMLHGASKWIKAKPNESRCNLVCGRFSMDTVIDPANGKQICAILSANEQVVDAVGRGGARRTACADLKSSSSIRQDYCLCADDGSVDSQDLRWTHGEDLGRCDRTCRSKNQGRYPFAVYGFYLNESWQHLCRLPSGQIGTAGGGISGCRTSSGIHSRFDCLCSKTYAGDLEPLLDP
jgi:hypothetical protein